jgi:hypothetical protein
MEEEKDRAGDRCIPFRGVSKSNKLVVCASGSSESELQPSGASDLLNKLRPNFSWYQSTKSQFNEQCDDCGDCGDCPFTVREVQNKTT